MDGDKNNVFIHCLCFVLLPIHYTAGTYGHSGIAECALALLYLWSSIFIKNETISNLWHASETPVNNNPHFGKHLDWSSYHTGYNSCILIIYVEIKRIVANLFTNDN